jgi:hypothetical protein
LYTHSLTLSLSLSFIQLQGIEVVTPQERKASQIAAAMRDDTSAANNNNNITETISFVVIPADASKPMEEHQYTCAITLNEDTLLKHIAPLFRSTTEEEEETTVVDLTLLQQQQQQQPLNTMMGSQDLPTLSHETLQQVAKDTHIETFSLVHPTVSNQFTSVQFYLDEVGMLKRLPLNKRASDLALRAGYNPPPLFYGSIVVGRLKYEHGRKQNISFTLHSMNNANWLLAATSQNLEYQQQLNQATGTKREQPAIQGTDGQAQVEQDYEWTQTEEELEVRVKLEQVPVNKKDIQIKFAPQSLQVIQPKMVLLSLFERIDVDSCTWTLDKDTIVIRMEKQEAAFWPRIRD